MTGIRLFDERRGAPARGLAGAAVPARGDLGRRRDELLALLRARRARRAVPVRRRRATRRARRAARAHRLQLARLPAGRRPGPALRLPRPRAVRPRAGPPLQPGQAAARPVRQGDRRARCDWDARRTSSATSPRRATTPTSSRRRGRRRRRSRSASSSTRASTGRATGRRDTPWHETVIYEVHVKGFTEAPPGRARGPARHLRGPRLRRGDRAPHGSSASPRSSCCRSTTSSTTASSHERGLTQLLGLQLDRLPRPARRATPPPARSGEQVAGVQGDGQGAPPRRHRGDPRRRLQPHRRGQPPRADALLPGHRQPRPTTGWCPTTRATTWTSPGTGNSAEPASTRSVLRLIMDSLRYWVDGDARRRLPLRPRLGARARALRRRPPVGLLRHHPPGPGALAGEADRRALGRRAGRLPGRQLPGALDGVERDVPRHRARLLARHRRRVAELAFRLTGSSDLYERDGRRPFASINFVTAHDGFTLADLVSYNDKHNEANGEDNRDGTDDNRSLELRRRGADRRPRGRRPARAASSATSWPRCSLSPGRADAAAAATRSAARSTATTTPTARTTRSSWFDWELDERPRALLEFTRRADRAAARPPGLPPHGVPRGPGA